MINPRGSLYEESAVSQNQASEIKVNRAFTVIGIIFFAGAGINVFFSFSAIMSYLNMEGLEFFYKLLYILEWIGITAALFLIGLTFFLFRRKFNVSYDYLYVEDELRLTKVINGRKRKYIDTVKMDMVLKIGWVGKPSYENTLRSLGKNKPYILTPNREPSEGKTFIYLYVTSSLGQRLYVLECREEMLEYLVWGAGRNKLERE